jgi:hypothetical protein
MAGDFTRSAWEEQITGCSHEYGHLGDCAAKFWIVALEVILRIILFWVDTVQAITKISFSGYNATSSEP